MTYLSPDWEIEQELAGYDASMQSDYQAGLPVVERHLALLGDLSHLQSGVYRIDDLELWEGATLARLHVRHDRIRHLACKPGRRGDVKGFSSSSRRRLLYTFAKVKRDSLPVFVTLTYPDVFPINPAIWKRDLNTLWKRIVRFHPDASCVWRLELKRRQSGSSVGQMAPHYHLLIWGVPISALRDVRDDGSRWLAHVWRVVVGGDGDHEAAGTRVEKLRSLRGAMSYASKYLGKSEKADDGLSVGRRWGVKGRVKLPKGRRVAWRVLGDEVWGVRRAMARLAGIKPVTRRVGGGGSSVFGRRSLRVSPLSRAAGLTVFCNTDNLVRLVREAWFF